MFCKYIHLIFSLFFLQYPFVYIVMLYMKSYLLFILHYSEIISFNLLVKVRNNTPDFVKIIPILELGKVLYNPVFHFKIAQALIEIAHDRAIEYREKFQ